MLCQTARVDVHGVPLLGDLLERLFIHNYSSTVSNVSIYNNMLDQSVCGVCDLLVLLCVGKTRSGVCSSEYPG